MANVWDAWRGRMAGALGYGQGGRRDLYGVLGYPRQIVPADYRNMYHRNGIANRVIRSFPQSTWRAMPMIRDEAGDSDEAGSKSYSKFVDQINKLFKKYRVLQYMERADRLASIGQCGVLFMGFRDGAINLSAPQVGRAELLYLAAYGQPNLLVSAWETNEQSPRFGLPRLYTMMTGTEKMLQSVRRSISADYTRVIHVAETLDQDEVYSTPRLMPVYNWLLDLEKVIGSSSETFWLNARGGLSLMADKDAKLSSTAIDDMKNQAQNYEQQLTRTLAMQGFTAQILQTSVASPQFHVEKLMDLISGATGIPKRLLMGSERSDLSSTQDEQNYSSKVEERQKNFAEPTILVPFVNKMIETGNVDPPQGEWWVEWPDAGALGPAANADIAVKQSQALASYTSSIGAENVVPVQEFRVKFLGLPSEPDAALDIPQEEPLDETDPQVSGQFADGKLPTGDVPVQDAGLNGAQIAALTAVVQGVIDKTMSPEAAIAIILLSFPGVDEATAKRMITPAVDFEAPPEPVPMLPPPGTVAPDAEASPPVPTAKAKAAANIRQRAAVLASAKLRKNTAPRTLYVRRDVLNGEEIRAHYAAQGVGPMTPASEMHVTVAYSTTAVDWTKIGEDWASGSSDGQLRVRPGGMRMMDLFGPENKVLVLLFSSSDLSWRWQSIRDAGASWSWGDYSPHVTITYDVSDQKIDVRKLEPWQGAIELGPEIWEMLNPDWKDSIVENDSRRNAP